MEQNKEVKENKLKKQKTSRNKTLGQMTYGEICEETLPEEGDIWKAASQLRPDPHKKQESLLHILSSIDSKDIYSAPPFSELLLIQLQYLSPVFWILQGGMLLGLMLLLFRLPSKGGELTDYLWWSSVAAAWLGVLSNGLLGRHFSSGMAELEQSCYINLTQMWTIRMILVTGVDIFFVLTVFSGGIALRTDTFFGRVAVYLLVPFILSNACCLLGASAIRGGKGKYILAALAVLTALVAAAPSFLPKVYTAAYLWVWFGVLLLGTLIFAGQIRICYSRMIRGEMVCWN